jgi:hypothetical protein
MSGQLGYGNHDLPARGGGNNRTSTTPETVLTEVRAVELGGQIGLSG